jgi:hypothetical protein
MRRFIFILVVSILIFFPLSSCNDSTNPISTFGDNSTSIESNDFDLNKNSFPNNKFLKVFRTAGFIDVDGNEAEWDNVPKHKMRNYFPTDNNYAQKFPRVNKSDLSAYFKLLWDDENFYVFVNIIDDEIRVDAETPEPWYKDSFELFIDGDNSKNAPEDEDETPIWPGVYDGNDDQIRFVWLENPVSTHGGFDVAQFTHAYKQTTNGWNLEISIPFDANVDFNAEPGKVFGIDFHINDNDNGSRDNMLKWWSENDYTWAYPSLFGSAYLFNSVAN